MTESNCPNEFWRLMSTAHGSPIIGRRWQSRTTNFELWMLLSSAAGSPIIALLRPAPLARNGVAYPCEWNDEALIGTTLEVEGHFPQLATSPRAPCSCRNWSALRESNPRTTGLQPATLPFCQVHIVIRPPDYVGLAIKRPFLNAPLSWQVLRDSNPHERFWRPSCCHYTKDLCFVRQRDRARGNRRRITLH